MDPSKPQSAAMDDLYNEGIETEEIEYLGVKINVPKDDHEARSKAIKKIESDKEAAFNQLHTQTQQKLTTLMDAAQKVLAKKEDPPKPEIKPLGEFKYEDLDDEKKANAFFKNINDQIAALATENAELKTALGDLNKTAEQKKAEETAKAELDKYAKMLSDGSKGKVSLEQARTIILENYQNPEKMVQRMLEKQETTEPKTPTLPPGARANAAAAQKKLAEMSAADLQNLSVNDPSTLVKLYEDANPGEELIPKE